MLQPFRAVAPPPIYTEKGLLLQSQDLNLAFSVDLVQEVLLKASVTLESERSITQYRTETIPVIFGRKSCPPTSEITLVLIKIPEVKGGLVAIACTNIPNLIAINPLDWQNMEFDTSPWQSDGKAYNFNGVIYNHVIGIVKKP
ncbi:hypothetical protein Syn7502_00984 [Synechococcus sp. PCC 7502]|uniref:hypothetical protein n=1 Tax=Synechococcus sp. PCC 7502 TaxID=1173263 RepID=UPI00029FC0DE|nr:hypothetical protein [Synechococcus sp. PCC 7502]AFY73099.1 hypothetical protein Syn7502_00984 [Synechococcus sp. PCC 7502]